MKDLTDQQPKLAQTLYLLLVLTASALLLAALLDQLQAMPDHIREHAGDALYALETWIANAGGH